MLQPIAAQTTVNTDLIYIIVDCAKLSDSEMVRLADLHQNWEIIQNIHTPVHIMMGILASYGDETGLGRWVRLLIIYLPHWMPVAGVPTTVAHVCEGAAALASHHKAHHVCGTGTHSKADMLSMALASHSKADMLYMALASHSKADILSMALACHSKADMMYVAWPAAVASPMSAHSLMSYLSHLVNVWVSVLGTIICPLCFCHLAIIWINMTLYCVLLVQANNSSQWPCCLRTQHQSIPTELPQWTSPANIPSKFPQLGYQVVIHNPVNFPNSAIRLSFTSWWTSPTVLSG